MQIKTMRLEARVSSDSSDAGIRAVSQVSKSSRSRRTPLRLSPAASASTNLASSRELKAIEDMLKNFDKDPIRNSQLLDSGMFRYGRLKRRQVSRQRSKQRHSSRRRTSFAQRGQIQSVHIYGDDRLIGRSSPLVVEEPTMVRKYSARPGQ